MQTSPPQAVLFDLDDTLHDDTEAYSRASERVAEEIARERPVDAQALRRAYADTSEAFWEKLSDYHVLTPFVGLRRSLWHAAIRTQGIDDEALAERAATAFNRYRKGYLRPFPGSLELLAALRARGLKLGMVTNGFAETHREKITLLELESAFDEILIADEVGMVKPDPRIFLHACGRMETLPNRTVMVGDRFDRDIKGAQAAGLFSVWFNVRQESVPPGAQPPDAIANDMDELSRLLLGMTR